MLAGCPAISVCNINSVSEHLSSSGVGIFLNLRRKRVLVNSRKQKPALTRPQRPLLCVASAWEMKTSLSDDVCAPSL